MEKVSTPVAVFHPAFLWFCTGCWHPHYVDSAMADEVWCEKCGTKHKAESP